MPSTDRQNALLIDNAWQKIYRTFSQADFKSYDFDTVRRTLIDYLRLNYSESFNDYIESSEYVALIDLISYIAQSISYRVDLNARENFIDLAERKESVLRLARLISYQPKRNIAGSGTLKITSITTSETVFDANSNNLANTPILWNDVTNNNWQEQFNAVLSAALPKAQAIGKPIATSTVGNVTTDVYRLNSNNLGLPLFNFTRNINGINTKFEIVPSTLEDGFVVEEAPIPGNALSFIYKNDTKGFASNNTGYFLQFKQGTLSNTEFSITSQVPNTVFSIPDQNINNDDVFLFKLDQNNLIEEYWTKVPAITGNNVIYNSVSQGIENQYAVITKENDSIDLVFSDGTYGTMPVGNFRTYYRQSNGLSYRIQTSDMQNITIDVDYVSRNNQINTLTITASLQSAVTNAARSQSINEIKTLAPQSYYTNNRMITPEDYQIIPLIENPSLAKVRSQVRAISGTSRFLDVTDPTGVYSETDIVADDGMLYKEDTEESFDFSFTTRDEARKVITSDVSNVFESNSLKQYYYDKYNRPQISGSKLWNKTTQTTNQVTGYFKDIADDSSVFAVGTNALNNLQYVKTGALLKFIPTSGSHFMPNLGTQMTGTGGHPGSADVIWTKVISVEGDGSNGGLGDLADGTGPIVLSDLVPTDAQITEIIPAFVDSITTTLETAILDKLVDYKNFGLGYDENAGTWYVIDEDDINTTQTFDLSFAQDTTGAGRDRSWLIRFSTNGVTYSVFNRAVQYTFQSFDRNKFYFDQSEKAVDPETGLVIKDSITVLKSNTKPDFVSNLTYDYKWQIVKNVVGTDGYNDTRMMQVGLFDSDDDGVFDNPDLFELIVAPSTSQDSKYVFFQTVTVNGFEQDNPIKNTEFVTVPTESDITNLTVYGDAQKFYFWQDDEFKTYNATSGVLEDLTGYKAKQGRQDLIYKYNHGAPRTRRLDPAVSNIVDCFVLTKTYDTDFRIWLNNNQLSTKPIPPSVSGLNDTYGPSLNQLKSISDTVVFNPGEYVLLFGKGAESALQATFKVVKNPSTAVSDNAIKSDLVTAINNFFALQLWDFGDTFYFTELAAYLHNVLAPDVLSVVIVPSSSTVSFGSLFEVTVGDNQLPISSATVDNVQIISSNTAEQLKASGTVVSSTGTTTTNGATSTATTASTTASSSVSSTVTSGSSGSGYY